eukprot:scaffold53732_cov78-Phaeocystis_antarctica.AAC.2
MDLRRLQLTHAMETMAQEGGGVERRLCHHGRLQPLAPTCGYSLQHLRLQARRAPGLAAARGRRDEARARSAPRRRGARGGASRHRAAAAPSRGGTVGRDGALLTMALLTVATYRGTLGRNGILRLSSQLR